MNVILIIIIALQLLFVVSNLYGITYNIYHKTQIKDLYKIPTLTENDKKLFKKYESEFTVNPPGRMFTERINNRVST
jgi:hypothetical protein